MFKSSLFKDEQTQDFKLNLKKGLRQEFPHIKPEVIDYILYSSDRDIEQIMQEQKFTPEQRTALYQDIYTQFCRDMCNDKNYIENIERVILRVKLASALENTP